MFGAFDLDGSNYEFGGEEELEGELGQPIIDYDATDEEGEEGEENLTQHIVGIEKPQIEVKERVGNQRRSMNVMTDYEEAQLLKERTLQIDNGASANPKVPRTSNDSLEIAMAELYYREPNIQFPVKDMSTYPPDAYRFPIKVVRVFPNGTKETWCVEELSLRRELEVEIL